MRYHTDQLEPSKRPVSDITMSDRLARRLRVQLAAELTNTSPSALANPEVAETRSLLAQLDAAIQRNELEDIRMAVEMEEMAKLDPKQESIQRLSRSSRERADRLLGVGSMGVPAGTPLP